MVLYDAVTVSGKECLSTPSRATAIETVRKLGDGARVIAQNLDSGISRCIGIINGGVWIPQ